jgi:hypothetical protein
VNRDRDSVAPAQQSQLIEFLTEIPGAPALLMVLSVQPSRIPVLAHGALGASGVSAAHVFRVLPCASLPLAQSGLDEGTLVLPQRY